MNELLKTKLFSLLAKNSQEVSNDEMKNAYENFAELVKTTVSQSEMDYQQSFRMLNVSRIELAFLKSLYRYEQGEKCPEISLYPKGFSPC